MRKKEFSVDKGSNDMTPMIDVVFQLLVFFLFTFKINPVEGEFSVKMPENTVGASLKSEKVDVTEPVNITMSAGADGKLASIKVGDRELGPSMANLSRHLRDSFVGPRGAAPDVEVQLIVESRLPYEVMIRATNAIMFAGITKINIADRRGGK